MPNRLIDIETRWSVTRQPPADRQYGKPAIGSGAYAEQCEVICVVTMLEDGSDTRIWRCAERGSAAASVVDPGDTLIAHGAGNFDRMVWEYQIGTQHEWIDTVAIARYAGLSAGLEDMSRWAGGKGKDGGESLANLDAAIYRYRSGGKRGSRDASLVYDIESTLDRVEADLERVDMFGEPPQLAVGVVRAIAEVVRYCLHDVHELRRVWLRLKESGLYEEWRRVEGAVWEADQAVMRRGFAIDRDLAAAIAEVDRLGSRDRASEIEDRHGLSLSSTKSITGWLATRGVTAPSLQRAAVHDLLESGELDPEEESVLLARLGESRVTRAKVHAAIASADSAARVRNWASYHSAHTGRWGGRGFQPQNLPRGIDADGAWLAECEAAVRAHDRRKLEALCDGTPHTAEDVLSHMVRWIITAGDGDGSDGDMEIADYSQIELCVLSWWASDCEMLDALRAGDDVYCRMASSVFGRPITKADKPERQLGKALVLGCGYGMGAARFEATSSRALEGTGLTAQQAVDAYRHHRVAVVQLWREVEHAFTHGGQVGPVTYDWEDGTTTVAKLPSGRRMRYRGVRVEESDRGSELVWHSPRGPKRLWGGLLVENGVQAVARDLLAHALVEAERAGMRPVLHVHDELVGNVGIGDVMRQAVPPWADGLPIRVTMERASRYGK